MSANIKLRDRFSTHEQLTAFIAGLYHEYGLASDPAGESWWADEVISSGKTENDMRNAIINSPEYQALHVQTGGGGMSVDPKTIKANADNWDEIYYLTLYKDVADAVKARQFNSGYDHFWKYGYEENRHWHNLADGKEYVRDSPVSSPTTTVEPTTSIGDPGPLRGTPQTGIIDTIKSLPTLVLVGGGLALGWIALTFLGGNKRA